MNRRGMRSTIGLAAAMMCVWLSWGVSLNAQEEAARETTPTNAPPAEAEKDVKLGAIVVTATRTPHTLKDVPVETVVVDRNDIARMNAQTAMDVIRSVPGINAAMHDDVFGSSTWRANLRGLSVNDGHTLVLIDGQRAMGCGQSGGMGEYGIGLNQIPADMIERVEVVKGPSSALYGSDAMSGVINIITKQPPRKTITTAGVAYGWYTVKDRQGSSGENEKPSDDGEHRNMSQAYVSQGGRVSDRVGYLVNYDYESAEGIGKDPVTSDRHSLAGRLAVDVTDTIRLDLKSEFSRYEKEDTQEEDSSRHAAGLEFRPNDEHFLAVKGYMYVWDFVHGFPGYSYGYKHGDIRYDQAEAQYTWYATERNALTVGAEFQRQGIAYLIENPDGSAVRVDEDVDTFSAYGQDEITLGEALTLIGGLRYDNHSTFGDEINPKASVMGKLAEKTTLRASVGKAFKSPTIRQLYYSAPYRHGSWYAQSNPDLKPETGIGYSASIEQWVFDDALMLNFGYFRNDVENMVVSEDSGETYEGLPLRVYRNVDEAWTQGVEAMLRVCPSGALSASLSYTYTASENRETGKDLTYVPEHTLTLVPAYDMQKFAMGTSAAISYVGRQYTDAANTAQIDEHVVVDAKVYKDFAKKRARLSFEADNIFDSDKGDAGNFRSGRTFLVKMDVSF